MSDWKGFKHRVKIDGDYHAVDNKDPASSGLISSDRVASPDETTMNFRPSGVSGDNNRHCLDVALSDGDGNGIDEQNPLPVFLTESTGDEVDEYDAGAATAEDATVYHNYTVSVGKVMKQIEAECSSTGFAVFALQVETGVGAGTFTTIMEKANSVSNPNVDFKYKKRVDAGIIVRVCKTNCDDDDTDLHSQIRGVETVAS